MSQPLSGNTTPVLATQPAGTTKPTVLQERFWIFDHFNPGTSVHHLATTIQSTTGFSREVLQTALRDLITQHEALGSRFMVVDGQPAIECAHPSRFTLDHGTARSRQEALRLIRDHARKPFTLVGKPLFRALLIDLPDESLSILSLVAHRIIADQQSLGLMITQLAQLYQTRMAGALPHKSQDSLVSSSDVSGELPHEHILARLREELSGAQLDINLPMTKARPAVPAYRSGQHRFTIPAQIADRVRSLAQQAGTPHAHVYLAGFQALLHRYGRQSDVLLGVELDRRQQPNQIGPYADLALISSHRSFDTTFNHLLQAAAWRLNNAASRPPAPLPLIAEALELHLGPHAATICRVAFAQRAGLPQPVVRGAAWICEPLDLGATEFDLELSLTEGAEGTQAALIYDAELFSGELIAAMGDHYLQLLSSALDTPDRPLYLLDMLRPADFTKIFEEFNNFPDLCPVDRPVHQLLEEQAARNPDALALSRGSEQLTYGELNRRANQLARLLHERIRQEETIAICMDRSPEWLITVLAAFKSGAVPVLLDPRAPAKRHEVALAVSPPQLILSLERLHLSWSFAPDRVIYIDRDWPLIERYDESNLNLSVDLDNLAYLVQTSGSTGTPKSVGVPHRVLAHCSVQKAAVYRITPETRSSWLAPPGASVSIIEIWPYLCRGASVHTVDPDVVASPTALRDWLIEQRINQLFIVTSMAELLWGLEWPPDCALQILATGSEKVRRWAPQDLPFEVTVEYGTSETTYVACSLQPWDRRLTSATASAEDRHAPPPMGRPWPGVKTYIVDDDLNLMPPGTVGELCIDSPEMARGYLGDPAMTALKFVPNPFPGNPGSRLYRSGDLVCQRSDGLLDHRGRVDTQVKILGYRVEVSEIEALLLEHAKITEAAVAAVPNPQGQLRLVAYLVMREPVSAAELRAFIGDRLPSYMVPSAYVSMTRLPRNFSNKVDRLALPAPDWESVQERQVYQAPRDEIERMLVGVWAELLQVSDVGINDHFFDLGGNSIMASRLATRVRERLSVDLNLRDILTAPTPAALAQRIRETIRPSRARALPQVVARKSSRP